MKRKRRALNRREEGVRNPPSGGPGRDIQERGLERASVLEDAGQSRQLGALKGVLVEFNFDTGGILKPGLPGIVGAELRVADGDALLPQVIGKGVDIADLKGEVVDVANGFRAAFENLDERARAGLEVVPEVFFGALEIKALFHSQACAVEAAGGFEILGVETDMGELLDHEEKLCGGMDGGKREPTRYDPRESFLLGRREGMRSGGGQWHFLQQHERLSAAGPPPLSW